MLPKVRPMELARQRAAFDSPDWVFEVKFDGYRALAYLEHGVGVLVSRRGHVFRRFERLADSIATEIKAESAILDGEIVCLDRLGRSHFRDLMYGRAVPYFYAFDLPWLEGEDLRELPLLERKARLRSVIPEGPSRVLYLDHIEERGVDLFSACCELDLEGIVAKPKQSIYRADRGLPLWIKIKNPEYTQAAGRPELFNSGRR